MVISKQITVPADDRERAIWVLGELKRRRESFASIGKRHGLSRYAARQAMFQPSATMEKALADAIDLKPEQLFPERYDREGNRLHLTREPRQQRSAAA